MAWANTNGTASSPTLVSRSHHADRILRYIFFLCGMGYMIDLLYAQAFGLIAPALQQELGFSSEHHQYRATSPTLTCLQRPHWETFFPPLTRACAPG